MAARRGPSEGGHDCIIALGARLAIVRKERSLTQAEFSRSIGVSAPAYHAYEHGSRSIPVRSLMLVVKNYAVDANWLLCGKGFSEQGADWKAAAEFLSMLLTYIEDHEIKIPAKSITAIVSRWHRELVKGRLVPFEDVTIWVDLLKE